MQVIGDIGQPSYHRQRSANQATCASSYEWTAALQLTMRQLACALRLVHSERARYEAAVRFGKPHDRPLAVPSVAPQPQPCPLLAAPAPVESVAVETDVPEPAGWKYCRPSEL
jgi:hypothetical protein